MESYKDSQIADIVIMKRQGLSWSDITAKYNKKYKTNKTAEAIRSVHRNYKDSLEFSESDTTVSVLQQVRRAKVNSGRIAKENRELLDFANAKEDLLEEIKLTFSEVKVSKCLPAKKLKLDKTKKNMTIEALLSDLHYGKKTKNFNLKVAKARMQELTDTILKEIERSSKTYNVERLILAMLGDMIESATMHGLESAKGCEFGNSKQIVEAVNSLFYDCVLPLAQTGIEIDVQCVTGNHDRTDYDRTYNNPGEENVTYIIYNMLEQLCSIAKLKNVKFNITLGANTTTAIYGNHVLYEHGDNAKSTNRDTLEKLLNKRQAQYKKIFSFFRLGHFHDYTVYGRGKIIVNGSLPGADSYSEILGFDTEAMQILNFYVETNERPTCFYRSFPVYLA